MPVRMAILAAMQTREAGEREEPRGLLGLSKRGKWLASAGLVAIAGLILWDRFGSWTPEQWSATAEVVTAIVALGAAFVGLRQLRESQALRLQQEQDALSIRRERAQPYVAVFMEPLTAVDPKFQELIIKNFGATAAYNVQVESKPEIVREWEGGPQKVPLPLIPTLVPGQEWRALWDFFPRRHSAGLPDRHDVKVRFEDSHGESFEFAYALDWGMNLDRLSVHTFGVHHGVKELQKVREQLANLARRTPKT
jgi:hypothetical protein